MRGHVYKRGETWTAVFDVGEQPRTRCASCDWKSWGVSARSRCPECREPIEVRRERRQRSKGGFPNKPAAEDHLALRLAEIARGTHVMPSDITVGEYLSRWLEVQRSQLEPTTWVNYRRRIARYFEPALGGIPLQALRVQHLNALYAGVKERGGAKGQPLSVATVRRLHAVLHKALNDAARQDLVAYNVASKATLPKRTSTSTSRTTSASRRGTPRSFVLSFGSSRATRSSRRSCCGQHRDAARRARRVDLGGRRPRRPPDHTSATRWAT